MPTLPTPLYPTRRRNGFEATPPTDDRHGPTSQAVIQAAEAKRIRRKKQSTGASSADTVAAIEASLRGMKRDLAGQPSPFSVMGRADPEAIAAGVPSDFASTLTQLRGPRTAKPMTPDQMAAMEAAGQRLDAAGPFASRSDRSADPRMANLRAAGAAEAAAGEQRGRDFVKFLGEQPKTHQDSYAAINQRRADAGLDPIAVPSDSEIHKGRMQQRDELTKEGSVGSQVNQRGREMLAQNKEAEKSHNTLRYAQGVAKASGVSVPDALVLIKAGLTKPAASNPATDPRPYRFLDVALFGPRGALELEQRREANAFRDREFKADQNRKDLELNLHALQSDHLAARSQLERRLSTATAAERGPLETQLEALDTAYGIERAQLLRGAAGTPPAIPGMPNGTREAADVRPGSVGIPAADVRALLPPDALKPGRAADGREIGSFPAVRDGSELARELARVRPSFPDLRAASADFARRELEPTFRNAYSPVQPWTDANGNQWPDAQEVSNADDLRYYLGRTRAKQILDEMRSYMRSVDAEKFGAEPPRVMLERLQNAFGAKYGDDAVRWAMAEFFNRPEWISNFDTFQPLLSPPPEFKPMPPVVGWSG